MGQRIEPSVSIPTKLQTDSTGYTLESVIHIGCDSPIRLLWNPGIFQIDHFYKHTKRVVPLLCVYKNGSSFREGKGACIVKFLAVC